METGPFPKGECMRCGFAYRLSLLRKEWSGARVCPDCYDPRPDDLRPIPVRPEGLPKRNASPETEPRFVEINEIKKEDL